MEKVKAAHAKGKRSSPGRSPRTPSSSARRRPARRGRRLRTLAANAEKSRTDLSIAADSPRRTGARRRRPSARPGDQRAAAGDQRDPAAALFRARRGDAARPTRAAAPRRPARRRRQGARGCSSARATPSPRRSPTRPPKSGVGEAQGHGRRGAGRAVGGGAHRRRRGELLRAKPKREISKFEHGFTHQFRKVDAFYAGLEGYVGTPSPDIFNAMEREHKSEAKFSSHNVRNTSPRQEFLYVTRMEVGQLADRKADASAGRFGWQLDDFVQHDMARGAKLLREEVIALRRGGADVRVPRAVAQPACCARPSSGEYVTTMHAIILGDRQALPPARAAPSTAASPAACCPSFFEPDEHGAVGGGGGLRARRRSGASRSSTRSAAAPTAASAAVDALPHQDGHDRPRRATWPSSRSSPPRMRSSSHR